MRTLFLAFLLGVTLITPTARAAEPGKRLNVLFIAVDDLRPELGCYGASHIKSPNIDALAARGLTFNRAYCQLALCNPSRASLLSGRRPESIKVFDLKTFVRDGNDDVVTLPQLFKRHGYRALRFGKIFHTTNGNHDDPESWSGKQWRPTKAPADTADAPDKTEPRPKPKQKAQKQRDPHEDELPYGAPECADDALSDGQIASAAVEALRENKDRPFFIAVGFHKPHLPFVAPKKYWDLYDPARIELPANRELPAGAPAFASNDASELRRYKGVPDEGPIDDEAARKLIHGYAASVSYVDAQVGRVMAELDRLKLADSTVVVLWGDHGYHLGEQGTWNKRTNWEIATRVPLIVATPGQSSAGKSTAALVELVDLYPTLAELCALPPPAKLEGTSFVPLLQNPEAAWKPAAFSIYQKNIPELGGVAYGRAMRTARYRFIEWSAPGGSKRVHELYDHENDPHERTNIARLGENQPRVAELAKQLEQGWRAARPEGK